MKVSVLTPTVPGREKLLLENIDSVARQTLEDVEHLVVLDEDWQGCSTMMNALAAQAHGEYLFPLADDDFMLPWCLENHVDLAEKTGAGIVYSPPVVYGEPPDAFWGEPPGIPAPVLIRADLWSALGGYDPKLKEREDRDLFIKAKHRGVVFAKLPYPPTWVYRFHGGNKSRGHLRRPRHPR